MYSDRTSLNGYLRHPDSPLRTFVPDTPIFDSSRDHVTDVVVGEGSRPTSSAYESVNEVIIFLPVVLNIVGLYGLDPGNSKYQGTSIKRPRFP